MAMSFRIYRSYRARNEVNRNLSERQESRTHKRACFDSLDYSSPDFFDDLGLLEERGLAVFLHDLDLVLEVWFLCLGTHSTIRHELEFLNVFR